MVNMQLNMSRAGPGDVADPERGGQRGGIAGPRAVPEGGPGEGPAQPRQRASLIGVPVATLPGRYPLCGTLSQAEPAEETGNASYSGVTSSMDCCHKGAGAELRSGYDGLAWF